MNEIDKMDDSELKYLVTLACEKLDSLDISRAVYAAIDSETAIVVGNDLVEWGEEVVQMLAEDEA